jgi:hypothetical protein
VNETGVNETSVDSDGIDFFECEEFEGGGGDT